MNEIMKNMNNEFFPTPISLLEKIELDFADMWEKLPREIFILEPSAGKGDIVEWFKKRASDNYYWRQGNKNLYFSRADIDCIEIEPELRSMLKGKSYHLVHDDFLTYNSMKRYDLIFMNPPFSNGDKHLLKAIDMQERYGGMVVCILNAETLRNPYSNVRKILKQKLDKYEAQIKFYDDMFISYDAERKTDVEVAVIAVQIPMPEEFSQSFIFDRLDKAKAEDLFGFDGEAESKEIVPEGLDFLDSYIKDYNDEVKAGVALLKEYSAYASVRKMRFGHIDCEHDVETLLLKVNGENTDKNSLNNYIEAVRLRYWKSLFINPNFVGKLTNKMQSELYASVNEMKYYDFTLHNILELMTQLRDNTLKGIEDSLMNLFDTFSSKYSYFDESSKNIHYYNGWKTNKAHKVNKKVIIPMYGVWSSWRWQGNNEWSLRDFTAISAISDLAKALDYIADPVYSSIDTHRNLKIQIETNFKMGNATNIETKYFILTFYKKGTCHIVFKDEDLLEKFNLYVGRQRDWLPPCYGRKAYKDLDNEERAVADSFSGGEEGYNKIYENQSKYLVDSSRMLLLAENISSKD